MSIHVAIPGDRNVIKKEAEKILKYKDLIIEIHCTWNVNVSGLTFFHNWIKQAHS